MALSKNLSDQEIDNLTVIKHITITDKALGRGSFGTVYFAILNGKSCVAKEVHSHLQATDRPQLQNTFLQERIIKECKILSKLRHPSIVQFFGVYYKDDSQIPVLLMERLWKTLYTLLEEQGNQLSLLTKTQILFDVACGLQYMHNQKTPVIHRDVNINNVMLTKHLEAKLIDLGQAIILDDLEKQKLISAPGNLAYMAPETLMSNPVYGTKVDVFSFGCTIIHLVAEKFPKATDQYVVCEDNSDVFIKVSEFQRRKEYFKLMGSSIYLQDIAHRCLEDIPASRPTAVEICGELGEYIQQLEVCSPALAEHDQARQGKFNRAELEAIVTKKSASILSLNEELMQARQEMLNSHHRERALLDTFKNSQAATKTKTVCGKESQLHRHLLELQGIYEEKCKELSDEYCQSYVKVFDQERKLADSSKTELLDLRKTCAMQKQQLEIKSDHLNAVEPSYIVLQELYSKQQSLEEENVSYRKILDNNDRMISHFENDLKNKENLLKRKGEELEMQKKEHKEKIANFERLLEATIKTHESNLADKENQIRLMEEKNHCNSEVVADKDSMTDEDSLTDLYQKYKVLEKENSIQKKLLEKYDRMQKTLDKSFKDRESLQKVKEEAWRDLHHSDVRILCEQYKRNIDDLNKKILDSKTHEENQKQIYNLLRDIESMYKKTKADYDWSSKERYEKLLNDIKSHVKQAELLKRQLKHKDAVIKEKMKCIESLERNYCYGRYNYDVHWYPYLSLPVARIRPSVAIIKDKVFVTGGYELSISQGKRLELCLQYFSCTDAPMFIFYLTKYRWHMVTSPVQMGALASVNDQCVLVSGADSVGNTLTGNVYVLSEEGKWKDFSKALPTPRVLACACFYKKGKEDREGKEANEGKKGWLIVCGGYIKPKKDSGFKGISIIEILDVVKEEWYTLSKTNCPNFSTILCCSVVGEEVYVVGSDQVIKTSCNKLIKAATSNDTLVWDNVEIETEESNGKLYPFSVVEVNGEPMIIASISGEDDKTCVLMKDTRGRWRITSKTIECQHCSAAVMTSSLELLLLGGSKKINVDKVTDILQKASLIPTLNIQGKYI